MYIYIYIVRGGLGEGGRGGLEEGGRGWPTPPLIERAVCLKDQAKGVGGGGPPPLRPSKSLIYWSKGGLYPTKKLVNNNSRKLQGASFRD